MPARWTNTATSSPAPGLRTRHSENHDDALLRIIDQVEARAHLARMTPGSVLDTAGVDIDAVTQYINVARSAVTDGQLVYSLLIAEKH
ncbi:hypothetical protein [Mycobacterium hubeiense]|uniref:hypothetical protein n=1 Tax=Mycobacterium hubeiense TaxID=1867256 RepID=UPI000C7ECA50|nr:hypothetical protein [Mycobacterium sp. QGD 101]